MLDAMLCFCQEEDMTNWTTGEIGEAIDLGHAGALRGRECWLNVISHAETTATGDPEIAFSVVFCDKDDFAQDTVEIPLSHKPATKEDLKDKGRFVARMPAFSLRYCKLKANVTGTIACSSLTCGISLDAPQDGREDAA